MSGPSPQDVATALAKVDALIVAINRDLADMPRWKCNTRSHLDKVKERRRLMAQRDFLINRQCELALSN